MDGKVRALTLGNVSSGRIVYDSEATLVLCSAEQLQILRRYAPLVDSAFGQCRILGKRLLADGRQPQVTFRLPGFNGLDLSSTSDSRPTAIGLSPPAMRECHRRPSPLCI